MERKLNIKVLLPEEVIEKYDIDEDTGVLSYYRFFSHDVSPHKIFCLLTILFYIIFCQYLIVFLLSNYFRYISDGDIYEVAKRKTNQIVLFFYFPFWNTTQNRGIFTPSKQNDFCENR